MRGGDPSQARTLAEKALSLRPDDADARRLLALSFFQIGQLERALVIYEGLLLDAPESASVKVNLAVVLLKLGRASAARPLLETVVAALPDHRRAWGYLGVAFEQLGLIAEAEGALLAGHHSGAARKLRERHGLEPVEPRWPEHSRGDRIGPACAAPPSGSLHSPPLDDRANDISFELTIPPRCALPPPAVSLAARDHGSPVPLLDAALSSLLVVPHRLSAIAHPGGFVVLRMLEGTDPREGGLAGRPELVHAVSGSVRKEALARRSPDGREMAPLARWTGSGRLVLAARGRAQLVPLHLDADEAFVRDDRVVGFDQRLLVEASIIALPSGRSLALSRFRGDGELILELARPPLALEIERDEALTLHVDSLVGWIGALSVEPQHDAGSSERLLAVRGEGTLLIAGPAADSAETWDE